MAKRVEIVLVDDIDGGDANETVRFALDGTAYEIDLSDGNATRLRESLAPYLNSGRRTSAAASRRGRTRRAS